MNLFEETKKALQEKGNHTFDDIASIQAGDIRISVDHFIKLAKDTNYDSGYGSQIVADDLMIIMKDGSRYERGEYDGAEWWEFVPIIKPLDTPCQDDSIKTLMGTKPGQWWSSLEQLNFPREEEPEEEEEDYDLEETLQENNNLSEGIWSVLDELELN
jgi:hypothetical protein